MNPRGCTSARRRFAAVALLLATSTRPLLAQKGSDEWLRRPVDDHTIESFRSFFLYDSRLPFETRVDSVTQASGVRYEHLSYVSTAGQRVPARLYRLIDSAGVDRSIVLLHGGNAAGQNSAGIRVTAEYLVRAGFNVLTFDLLHFGGRQTGLLTTYAEADRVRLYNEPSTYLAWITQNVKDVGRAYDFLVKERGARPSRVGLVGLSRGAVAASVAGGADKRFAAVALVVGGHHAVYETGHLAAACPANWIGRIAPRPLLMMNVDNDGVFNREQSVLPLYRLARQPKKIGWSPGGHAVPQDSLSVLSRWLTGVLK